MNTKQLQILSARPSDSSGVLGRLCDAERRDALQAGASSDERGRSERTRYANPGATRVRTGIDSAGDGKAAATDVNHTHGKPERLGNKKSASRLSSEATIMRQTPALLF